MSLCHLPAPGDDLSQLIHDDFDDDEVCMDTVLRYRHPTADGSNYLRCLLVNPCSSYCGPGDPDNIVASEQQTPSDEAVAALSASRDLVLIFLCSNFSTTPHQVDQLIVLKTMI